MENSCFEKFIQEARLNKIPIEEEKPIEGLYILFNNEEITYIGSSRDIKNRLVFHKNSGNNYTHFYIIRLNLSEEPCAEGDFIYYVQPKNNKCLSKSSFIQPRILSKDFGFSLKEIKQLIKKEILNIYYYNNLDYVDIREIQKIMKQGLLKVNLRNNLLKYNWIFMEHFGTTFPKLNEEDIDFLENILTEKIFNYGK